MYIHVYDTLYIHTFKYLPTTYHLAEFYEEERGRESVSE